MNYDTDLTAAFERLIRRCALLEKRLAENETQAAADRRELALGLLR